MFTGEEPAAKIQRCAITKSGNDGYVLDPRKPSAACILSARLFEKQVFSTSLPLAILFAGASWTRSGDDVQRYSCFGDCLWLRLGRLGILAMGQSVGDIYFICILSSPHEFYYLYRNPISFHERIYFLTRSSLTGPVALNVGECSLLLTVSMTNPPHDMRTKCPSRKSTSLPAGLSTSMDPGNRRTRLTHS